jgi:hypothetical protein
VEKDWERNEFEEAVQADMMVNTLIRIAKDLERAIIGIFATAGIMGAILFVLILRWMLAGN